MHQNVTAFLQKYLEEPSTENFLRLREAVAASPDYAPYGVSPDNAGPLFDQNKFAEAEALLRDMMRNFLLNPRVHKFLSFAYDQQGDKEKARIEYQLANLCLEGILSTGTGEEVKPYLVLHIEDEYDLLRHLGKKSRKQSLTKSNNREFDVFECDDGSLVWFDISVPREYLARRFNERR
jgi:hypothetical protein